MPHEHRVEVLLPTGRLHVCLPINRRTINTVFSVNLTTEEEIQGFLSRLAVPCEHPHNAAEHLASTIGVKLRDLFFRPYTRKMWELDLEDLDAAVVRRIPLRFDDDDRYFPGDRIQFMPRDGYTALFQTILEHKLVNVQLGTAFEKPMLHDYDACFNSMAIDEYFEFAFGPLPYRSIRFHHRTEPVAAGGGRATVINFSDDQPFTRETHWDRLPCHRVRDTGVTTVTPEEPCDYAANGYERYYPVKTSDDRYGTIYQKRQSDGRCRSQRCISSVAAAPTNTWTCIRSSINRSPASGPGVATTGEVVLLF